ncbi:endonuclease domain-containing 1 protein-like [Micropterus salmoides]|uniref:endonuclease domain-containing 1 protein-like n=1 Tax=Micropterus salmoides TaxID=27706 RepID=UPI0018EBA3B6|nr:endonuclease domain-containing 1 protein-like [Micropterus salmoides]XP_038588249.1 endonuclease domain-containing 1 protein-like [Micropterus salmoides]
MTSMKMWYLLLLAAFLPIVPTVAEVVESVSDCDQFLLEAKPPHVPGILEGGKIGQTRYKLICQTYKNERKFLTLYDTENMIPVFSAYKYTGKQEGLKFNRPKKWMIEPQLENKDDPNKDMANDNGKTYKNQAVEKDYIDKDKKFNRGHIIPSSYGLTESDKKSTFTLTNIVPQAISFNSGSWSSMEQCIKCIMDEYCKDNNAVTKAYVVTGAIPNPSTDPNTKLNKRVNIPDKLWSAFCCYDSKKKKWIASAHWGDNVPDKPERKYLPTITLQKLQEELKIVAFPETQCPLQTTVSEFYKTQAKHCQCQKT